MYKVPLRLKDDDDFVVKCQSYFNLKEHILLMNFLANHVQISHSVRMKF